MARSIIKDNPTEKRVVDSNYKINVAEFFSRTIQGEGVSTGYPAAFLRVKDCSLNCVWCDSTEVWRKGNPYTYEELYRLMEENELIDDLKKGHHLVLTGGSPLKQQKQLAEFFALFQIKYGFIPFIEVENECMYKPTPEFAQFISQWNNSPKLENSEMKKKLRYKFEVLKETACLPNSWFKFVIVNLNDWKEVEEDFINAGLILREQVIVMPCGSNQEELSKTREFVANLAVEQNVLYSDRAHITIWDKKTGV